MDFILIISLFVYQIYANPQIGKECQLIEAFQQRLQIDCIFKVINPSIFEKSSLSFPWRCNNQMGWMPIHKNLCVDIYRTCEKNKKIIILSDIPSELIRDVDFKKCIMQNFFIYFWKLNNLTEEDLDKVFENTYITMDCRFIVVKENENGYDLHEIYRISRDSPLQIINIGFWNITHGFNQKKIIPNIYSSRQNLQGLSLTVAVQHSLPYCTLDENKNTHGIIAEYWTTITDYLNVNPEYYLASDSEGMVDNSTWSGAVGDVQTNKTDVGMMILLQNEYRLAGQMLTSILRERYYMFFRLDYIPKTTESVWTIYIHRFDLYLWILLLLFILIFAAWDFFGFLYQDSIFRIKDFIETVLQKTGTASLQASSFENKVLEKQSGRIGLISFIILTQILNMSFSSDLISSLVSSKSSIPFNNLESLMNFGEYNIFALPSSTIYRIIKNSNDEILQKLETFYLNKKLSKEITTRAEMADYMDTNPRFTFISDESRGKELLKFKPYKMYYIKFISQASDVSLIITKSSPYEKFFNNMIRRMFETGVRKHIRLEYLGRKERLEEENEFNSIELNKVTFPFVILLSFYLVSLFLLLMEILHYKRTKKLFRKELLFEVSSYSELSDKRLNIHSTIDNKNINIRFLMFWKNGYSTKKK